MITSTHAIARARVGARGLVASLALLACGDSGGGTSDASTTTTGETAPATDATTSAGSSSSTSEGDATTSETTGAPAFECDFQGVDFDAGVPDLLSDMCLVRWTEQGFELADNVYPYELNTVLFSDYALKQRAIYIPPGATAEYRDNEVLELPVGSIILKSFIFPADLRAPELAQDLIETRVLVRFPEEWKAYPYIWDHELGDALLTVQGEIRPIEFIGLDGEPKLSTYLIPQKNQCQECHEIKDENDETVITPIGPRPRYLNRDADFGDGPVNQLQRYADAGWLTGVPPIAGIPKAWDHRALADTPVADMSYAEVTTAARDYLDINCAYCHNPRGVNGISSQLFLNWDNEDVFHLGFCKKPGSAGKGGENRDYDIVPGDAEASILIYRTETLDLGSMMPLIGRSLAHEDGSALLRAWIDGLPPDDCGAPDPMP
ncbi:MAG: hypothetical protein H6713_18640 [Myxococcales bacterium]|nr:hypothetical protein [Myxococcales bacterium]